MVMSATGSDFAGLEKALQQALNVQGPWAEENNIEVNSDKITSQLFSLSTKHHNIQLCYKSKGLSRTNASVYLDIHLDSKLTWKKHIDTAINRGHSRAEMRL
ncbi:hypothetical protein NPIL_560291 [Nephila pilipes]|uniref:Uncharacterized protein n=1 Tax=Nephila pilipes TaxID=299642 RepID=A0A8X6QIM5_NEPPI|nr:hypothetical protein NPIL_560291 [Nephila pilipes]